MGDFHGMDELTSRSGEAFLDKTECEYEGVLQEDFQKWSEAVVKSIGGHDASPEHIVRDAFRALTEADGKRFILTNLLEGLKGGQPLPELMKRYNEIGLTNFPIERISASVPITVQPKSGKVVRTLLGKLADFCRSLIRVALGGLQNCDTIKAHITPSVGWAGWTPTLALGFGVGVNFKDVLDFLNRIDVRQNPRVTSG